MKTGHSKFKSVWRLFFLPGFLLTGCIEALYVSQWHEPSTSYVEPASKKIAEENRTPLYRIDCSGGVICYGPDEEKTNQKDGLVTKDCLWKNIPYKNGPPGLVWLTFSKKGDGCWQLYREGNEEPKKNP
jgi:hypothetical protein